MFARIGRWGKNRFGLGTNVDTTDDGLRVRRNPHGLVRAVTHEVLGDVKRSIGLRPKTLEPEGWVGRHSDGGQKAFATMVERKGLNDDDLAMIEDNWRRTARSTAAIGALPVIVGLLFIIWANGVLDILLGIACLLFSLVFFALALRADFAQWQIRQRRFAGFRDYLDIRWRGPAGTTGKEQ